MEQFVMCLFFWHLALFLKFERKRKTKNEMLVKYQNHGGSS
jgi:hypothetical protein